MSGPSRVAVSMPPAATRIGYDLTSVLAALRDWPMRLDINAKADPPSLRLGALLEAASAGALGQILATPTTTAATTAAAATAATSVERASIDEASPIAGPHVLGADLLTPGNLTPIPIRVRSARARTDRHRAGAAVSRRDVASRARALAARARARHASRPHRAVAHPLGDERIGRGRRPAKPHPRAVVARLPAQEDKRRADQSDHGADRAWRRPGAESGSHPHEPRSARSLDAGHADGRLRRDR